MMLYEVVNDIYHCMLVRDDINNSIYADPPACLPQQFVLLWNRDFTILVVTQMTHLSVINIQEEIALLDDEFGLLRTSYRVTDVARKTAIDALPEDATFEASWSIKSLAGRNFQSRSIFLIVLRVETKLPTM